MANKIHELCKDIVCDFFTKSGYSLYEYSGTEHFRVDLDGDIKEYIYVTEARKIYNNHCYWLDTYTAEKLQRLDLSETPTFICIVDFEDGKVYYEKLRKLEERTKVDGNFYPITLEQQHVWNKYQFVNGFIIKDCYIKRYKELTDNTPVPTKVHKLTDSTPTPTQTRLLTDKEIVQQFAELVGLSPREVLIVVINEHTTRFESKRKSLRDLLDSF